MISGNSKCGWHSLDKTLLPLLPVELPGTGGLSQLWRWSLRDGYGREERGPRGADQPHNSIEQLWGWLNVPLIMRTTMLWFQSHKQLAIIIHIDEWLSHGYMKDKYSLLNGPIYGIQVLRQYIYITQIWLSLCLWDKQAQWGLQC